MKERNFCHLNRLTQGQMTGGKGRETLSYTYTGNKLSSVNDAISTTATHEPFQFGGATAYTYDVNGNMKTRTNTTHTGNNISNIVYNHLNLPSSVTATAGNVSYSYEYFLRDHLGNNRSGFKAGSSATASFRSDYYAFGLQYPSDLVVGSPKNNYLLYN